MRRNRSVKMLAGQLADVGQSIRLALLDDFEPGASLKAELRAFWNRQLGVSLPEPELADATAQAIVMGQIVSVALRPSKCLKPQRLESILTSSQLLPLLPKSHRLSLEAVFLLWRSGEALTNLAIAAGWEPLTELIEQFLSRYDGRTRKARGMYYTPYPVARCIVRSVDELLRREFHPPDGLGGSTDVGRGGALSVGKRGESPSPTVGQILDPAAGTGIFLLAAIDLIHGNCIQAWSHHGASPDEIGRKWNDYVENSLLNTLCGYELLPAVALIANDLVAVKLALTGFLGRVRPIVRVHNPLEGPPAEAPCKPDQFSVVVGNPPFSGISENNSDWIRNLLRGNLPGGQRAASYYEVDGGPLTERKVWLQDDYVKFFRYAQWLIESCQAGVLGFVTNHGYLENISFRGMRESLLEAFANITIVDLHGSRKKHEKSPDGSLDENVFDIEQGVAICVCSKPPSTSTSSTPQLNHGDLWGDRTTKLLALRHATARQLAATRIVPRSPDYFFYPQTESRAQHRAYDRSPLLTEVMPYFSSAVVTARDSFVVSWDREELIERIGRFRNLSISDEEIRAAYFTKSRSANTNQRKYPPGDTRGWKLPEARRQVAEDDEWQHRVRLCSYRPWDVRWIYWANWMVDWPRPGLARHTIGIPNQLLVARRQMPRHQPCNYFWACDKMAIDGVIRSDNRGNESLFPLYIYDDDEKGPCPSEGRRANFNAEFVNHFCHVTGMDWTPDGRGDLVHSAGPEDLFSYIYASFFSTRYRSQFAEQLRVDFPRIVVLPDRQFVVELCRLGKRLLDLHQLNRETHLAGSLTWQGPAGSWRLATGFPRFDQQQQRVYLSRSQWVGPVPQNVWDYRVGIHQVCRKWLKDRRGRNLTPSDRKHYLDMVSAVGDTLEAVAKIDCLVEEIGGWEVD